MPYSGSNLFLKGHQLSACDFHRSWSARCAGLLFTVLVFFISSVKSQQIIPLYKGPVPNAKPSDVTEAKMVDQAGFIRYDDVTTPTLEVCLPSGHAGLHPAVLIIPGGGYKIVSYTNEGTDIAAEFNNMGIAAFILKYRLPSDQTMIDKSVGPIQDAQTALDLIRTQAKTWNIDPGKVGVIGFSAGGHLASTLGTHFNHPYLPALAGKNLRPDFMILGYPVIDLSDSLMHRGSRENLLGETPDTGKIKKFSANLQVGSNTPPTFLLHASDDKSVKVENSLRMYEALIKHHVIAEMHIYYKGGHGFGIRPERAPDHWTDRVSTWLKNIGILEK